MRFGERHPSFLPACFAGIRRAMQASWWKRTRMKTGILTEANKGKRRLLQERKWELNKSQ
jgi:hypothetical protein